MTRALDWIKEIESTLVELDEKPQFTLPKPFDWAQFEKELQDLLQRPGLTVSHTVQGWVASHQLLEGVGGSPFSLSINWLPLKSSAFLVTDQQNLKDLMSFLFESDEAANFFYDSSYIQGFYHYFAAEILRLIEKQKFATPLTPRIGGQISDIKTLVGDESCFCLDLSLNFSGKNLWARLLLPESFRKEWKTSFAQLKAPPLSEELKEKLMVTIGIEAGYSRLTYAEWAKVKNGDFVLLDRCSYDPAEHEGSVALTLNQKPIFRGRLKNDGIKITNTPIYEEVADAMKDDPFEKDLNSEDEDDDLFSDLDLDDDDSEFEEDEDDFDAPAPKNEAKADKKTSVAATDSNGPFISPPDLPVHLTVEVGRIQMTAAALMNLAPGNLIDLKISPEQGVDLVINGKKVGRGELIRMGDVLGVRILAL